jgi:hypothetical protein
MSKPLSWLWAVFGLLLVLGVVAAIEMARVQAMVGGGRVMMAPAIDPASSSLA